MILIETTKKCNRGCRHCMADSKPDTEQHLTVEMGRTLLKKIHLLVEITGQPMPVCFTGGGEPFLNPYFPELFEIFASSEDVDFIPTVTSGFAKKDAESVQLEGVIHSKYAAKFRPAISYHKYANFNERLKNTLAILMETEVEVAIKVTYSYTNFIETFRDLHVILEEFGLKPFLLPTAGFSDDKFFKKKDPSEKDRKVIKYFAYSTSGTYFSSRYDKEIQVRYQPLVHQGRAKKLKDKIFVLKSCRILKEGKIDRLYLDCEGNWYLCCGNPVPGLRIGKLEDDLTEIFQRASQRARVLSLAKFLCEDISIDICSLCARMAAKLFSKL